MVNVSTFVMILLVTSMNFYLLQDTKIEKTQTGQWDFSELAQISTGGDAYTVKVKGDYCYVSCGYSGFRVFDISNLTESHLLAHIPQPTNGYAHQFIIKNNLTFVGNGYGGIWIINCTSPEAPSVITEYKHDYSWDIQINNDIIYAGNGHIQAQDSLTLTNISDETNPLHIKTILTPDHITDLKLIGNRLYAAGSEEGFLIYDINNKTDPKRVGTYIDPMNPDIYLVHFDVVEEIAFVCYNEYGMKVLNVSDPSNITLIIELLKSNSDYYSIHILDNLAYISDINNGIQVLNVSTVGSPIEIASYTYDKCGTNDIFKRENILFVADRNLGLIIFKIANETSSAVSSSISSTESLSAFSTTSETTSESSAYHGIILFLLFGSLIIFIKRRFR